MTRNTDKLISWAQWSERW
ncbi:unnamed protein product, partial [Rotaria magnacalcarata]